MGISTQLISFCYPINYAFNFKSGVQALWRASSILSIDLGLGPLEAKELQHKVIRILNSVASFNNLGRVGR